MAKLTPEEEQTLQEAEAVCAMTATTGWAIYTEHLGRKMAALQTRLEDCAPESLTSLQAQIKAHRSDLDLVNGYEARRKELLTKRGDSE